MPMVIVIWNVLGRAVIYKITSDLLDFLNTLGTGPISMYGCELLDGLHKEYTNVTPFRLVYPILSFKFIASDSNLQIRETGWRYRPVPSTPHWSLVNPIEPYWCPLANPTDHFWYGARTIWRCVASHFGPDRAK